MNVKQKADGACQISATTLYTALMMMEETVSAENFQIKWLMNTNINFKTKKKKNNHWKSNHTLQLEVIRITKHNLMFAKGLQFL